MGFFRRRPSSWKQLSSNVSIPSLNEFKLEAKVTWSVWTETEGTLLADPLKYMCVEDRGSISGWGILRRWRCLRCLRSWSCLWVSFERCLCEEDLCVRDSRSFSRSRRSRRSFDILQMHFIAVVSSKVKLLFFYALQKIWQQFVFLKFTLPPASILWCNRLPSTSSQSLATRRVQRCNNAIICVALHWN